MSIADPDSGPGSYAKSSISAWLLPLVEGIVKDWIVADSVAPKKPRR